MSSQCSTFDKTKSARTEGFDVNRDNSKASRLTILSLRKPETVTEDIEGQKSLQREIKEPNIYLFGNDLTIYSLNIQFSICACGVFVFNLLYGYLQELLAVHIAGRRFALFLAACQFAVYAFWARILSHLNNSPSQNSEHIEQPRQQKILSGKFIGLSLLRAFDLAVTNMAMIYLNYPAKTLIKSCRVVFTMLMSVLIQNKRYKSRDYIAVFILVAGLFIFLHADSTSSAIFHPWGVLLLLLSLMCDGTLNNWSEQMMKSYDLNQDEFHSRLYSVSFVATILAAYLHNELFEGIDLFLLRAGTIPDIEAGNQVDITWTQCRKTVVLILFGTSGIMGASCLGAITKRFGALTMALTSTARKATTLFLSFAAFENQCTLEHFVGVFLFLSGLTMKTFNKKPCKSEISAAQSLHDINTPKS